MTRGASLLTFLLLLPAPAGAADAPRDEEKGTYLGALFSPVSEALYDHLPQLPRNQGVLVTHVLPDSPAARADLRRHDLLYRYDDRAIRDCEHFARLIRADRPGRKVKLTLLRGGRETTADVTLALGPVLKIASAARDPGPVAKGVAKPGGPPTVSVSATPLENGQLKLTIEYYQRDTGRLRTMTCQGDTDDIRKAVRRQLPARERRFVEVALKRLHDLNFQKAAVPESRR